MGMTIAPMQWMTCVRIPISLTWTKLSLGNGVLIARGNHALPRRR
jgi:hypothetical protein